VSLLPRLRSPLHPEAKRRPPRIAIVSGSLAMIQPRQLLTLGAHAVFQKPIVPAVLLSWVQQQITQAVDGSAAGGDGGGNGDDKGAGERDED
jgi:CheY-like chemotaxis protein